MNTDVESYCKKVALENSDILILSASCFTQHDFELAKKVKKKYEKSVFFVRTMIDQDIRNEWNSKRIEEDETLSVIREDCVRCLTGLGNDDKVVILINNHKTTKLV